MLLMNRACTVFPFLCSETHRTKILLPSYLSLNIPILHYMRLQETFYRANLSMLHFKYSSILQFKSCLLSNKTWIALSPVKWLSAGGVKKIGNHFNLWTKAAKSRKWLQAHKGYFVKGGKCTWGKRKGPLSTKDFFPLPIPSVTSATHQTLLVWHSMQIPVCYIHNTGNH